MPAAAACPQLVIGASKTKTPPSTERPLIVVVANINISLRNVNLERADEGLTVGFDGGRIAGFVNATRGGHRRWRLDEGYCCQHLSTDIVRNFQMDNPCGIPLN